MSNIIEKYKVIHPIVEENMKKCEKAILDIFYHDEKNTDNVLCCYVEDHGYLGFLIQGTSVSIFDYNKHQLDTSIMLSVKSLQRLEELTGFKCFIGPSWRWMDAMDITVWFDTNKKEEK